MRKPGLLFLFLVLKGTFNAQMLLGYSPNPHLRDTVITFSAGGGIAFSAVNMGIEPIGEIKRGYNGRLAVRFKRRIGLITEYTYQVKHDAIPAWGAIQASNIDLNLSYMYLTVGTSNTRFYGLIGACYQQWQGTYLGTPAFDRDIYNYVEGTKYNFSWVSMNLGIGFERYYKYAGLFGEFKFRFGRDYLSDSYSIMDACFTLGLKKNLFTLGAPSVRTPSNHRNHKKSIKPKQYHWF
ncbi:MAG: hypothetical protein ACHQRM_17785 [Bacteroidia bacterium]